MVTQRPRRWASKLWASKLWASHVSSPELQDEQLVAAATLSRQRQMKRRSESFLGCFLDPDHKASLPEPAAGPDVWPQKETVCLPCAFGEAPRALLPVVLVHVGGSSLCIAA